MKVACMGSAASSVRLGPYMDKSWSAYQQGKPQHYPQSPHINEAWQIWGCSPGLFGYAPRATRWFEVHRWEPGQEWFSPEYCQFLREFNGPVYTGGPIPEIKNHIVYPIARVEAEFSSFFLNSSLSLMAAIAILEIEDLRTLRKMAPDARRAHPALMRLSQTLSAETIERELGLTDSDDVIGFWGVDMSANEEYSRQKPGCWFFMLECTRRGVGLFYPPESDLGCPEPIYGLCEWDHAYIKATARMREINARMESTQRQLSQAQQQLSADIGARDDLNYHIKTWISPYRLPPGIVMHQVPGTGLGVSVVEIDGAPVKSGAEPAAMVPYTGQVKQT